MWFQSKEVSLQTLQIFQSRTTSGADRNRLLRTRTTLRKAHVVKITTGENTTNNTTCCGVLDVVKITTSCGVFY